jgi:hypothetical protein
VLQDPQDTKICFLLSYTHITLMLHEVSQYFACDLLVPLLLRDGMAFQLLRPINEVEHPFVIIVR